MAISDQVFNKKFLNFKLLNIYMIAMKNIRICIINVDNNFKFIIFDMILKFTIFYMSLTIFIWIKLTI